MARLILEPSEMRLLEGLRLHPVKAFTGRVRGERLTRRRGLSIEFSDYREYAEGDDLRHLDWNVLARLDSPIMKTYRDEEDLAVHVMLDASASMSFGEPSKFELAKRVAAGICLTALIGGDAVYLHALGQPAQELRPYRSRVGYTRCTRWLQSQRPEGMRGLAESLTTFAKSGARPGLAVVISDFLDPEASRALKLVAARGHELMVLQVLSRAETDPDLEGDLRLIDSETGDAVEITANSLSLKEYHRRFAEHQKQLQDIIVSSGGRYALADSDMSVTDVVRRIFMRQRWLAA